MRARAGLLLVLLSLLLWQWLAWWWPRPPPQARPPPAVAPAVPARPLAQQPPPPSPGRLAVPPRPVAMASAAAQAPPAAPVPGCAAADDAATLAAWLAAMQASADERQRAAGWLIALPDDHGETLRDRLATLAATSTDPVVQAYAQRACRSTSQASSACLALPVDAWPRSEPDNAAAWLALAADPRADATTQADARRQAALARRFDAHLARLPTLAAATQPAAVQPADWLAMAAAIGRSRADWLATEALRSHCVAVAPQDEGPRADCTAIAELLLQQAQTLPDLQQARELGGRLGWPADRLQALRAQEDRLEAAWRQRTRIDDPQDCAAMRAVATVLRTLDHAGEVAAMRRVIDAGPRP